MSGFFISALADQRLSNVLFFPREESTGLCFVVAQIEWFTQRLLVTPTILTLATITVYPALKASFFEWQNSSQL